MSVIFLTGSAQVDNDLTLKTKALYENLRVIQSGSHVLFGQEFFNSFRYSSGGAHGDKEFSDCKSVTGAHPAVLGSDFHYYLEKNDTERGYHREAVKWAFQQGYVITFDWHISARGTTSYSCTGAPANLAKNIVNGNANGDRDWFLAELDKVIEIINEELVVDGDTVPIVFRPFHEMNGNWFWWGACSGLSANEYKLLYQLLVDYMKARTCSVLFCWSPNSSFNSAYYPGDDYVDFVGVDAYETTISSLRSELGKVVDFAIAHDKIAIFSETGNRNADANSGLYWKDVVLPGIVNDPTGKSKRIAWVLTWINSSWSEPYVPHSGSSSTVRQSFIDFKNSGNIIFGDEIPQVYIPNAITSIDKNEIHIQMTNRIIKVLAEDFETTMQIFIYNSEGQEVSNELSIQKEWTYPATQLNPGLYLIVVSDGRQVKRVKFIVE